MQASTTGVLQKLARVFKEKAAQDLDRIVKGTSKTREKLGVSAPSALPLTRLPVLLGCTKSAVYRLVEDIARKTNYERPYPHAGG